MSRIPDKVRQPVFEVGHRVVVKNPPEDGDTWWADRWLQKMVGHYGHVIELLPDEWVIVRLQGRIAGPVVRDPLPTTGWAFMPEELEHAD